MHRITRCPSANPARVPGRSGLPRVPLSALSARKRSGAESLATPSGISRAATSVACRSSVSGHRSSSSKHTRGQSRETGSLSRLFSSVETTAKCISLGPADCRERLSYSIRRSAATFQRVVSHEHKSRAGSGIRTRGQLSSEEGGHRGGPSSRQRVRVLQPVLRCSKEGWRVTSNFRSAATEPLSQPPEVQNAYCKTGRVSDQIRGLVRHDRSKRRLFPCIHPSQSQEVPEVRFQGQSLPISGSSLRPSTLTPNFHEVRGCCTGASATSGHPHTQLHRRLVDFSSFRAVGGSTSRCRSRSHERIGIKTKCKKKCAVSIPENNLSRRGVGFDHDAGTIVPCSDRVDSQHGQESQRRPVTHCQAVSKTVGSDGSSVQRDTFWPAVHETPTVVAQVQGVLPEGKPILHDQGHAAMPTCLGHVEETLVLVSGPGPGSSLPPRNASDGCIPDRLGSGHEWPPCPQSVEWSPSHVAHQLPGDAGHVSSTETFSSGPKKSQCTSTHRQHSFGFLYQPPGRSAFAPLMQAGAPDPCVVPGQVPLAESGLYSWASQCRSRHPVEAGAEARGMEASPRGGEADLESFWPGTGGSVCDSSDIALSPLVLSDSSGSAGAGCYGTDVAEASSVRLSPDCSAPGSSRESAPGRGPAVASSPVLAGPSMVLGPDFSPRRLPMGDSSQERSPLTSGGYDLSSPPGVMEAVCVAPEGAQLIASGLSTEVVETILQSRAPSTRKLYGLKWRLFTSWCGDHQLDPVNCPIGTVLEFLQARFSAGLSHSTLRVYVAAIASYHAPVGGQSVGKDPLIIRFLRGVLRLRPRVRSRVPPWDLAVVLEALCKPPFEPIEQVSERLLTLKTVLLLAISSLKRVGDLQALSVASIDFTPGLAKVFLYPRVGYVPKVPSSVPRPVILQAFCPPPFREPNQEKLNCMCPVRALDAYVHRTALWRKSDQLLVCYGPPKKGFPAAKQTLSRWIVDAIIVAYESSDLPSSLGVKAHSTRGMAASKAFFAGVPIQDICDAAGWSTPLTFVRFYDLDLQATPGSVVLLP